MSDYDLLALGEVMLRLDPGEGRVRCARSFTASEGGGEYNVARALSKCFGLQTGILTALVDNDVGRLLEDLIDQGRVDTRFIKWVPHDGIGRKARNALNFTERGFGVRGARGCIDRGHSAASQLTANDFDLADIFSRNKISWLHTGGIFAALSEETASLTSKACQIAHEHGARVSYDLNYRGSLWQERGGFAAAQQLNRQILPHVDFVFGTLSDAPPTAGTVSTNAGYIFAEISTSVSQAMTHMLKEFPNIQGAAATFRRVHTASRNDWGGLAFIDNTFYRAKNYPNLAVMDRVGGGDGFAAGIIYGLLTNQGLQLTIDLAVAHGALAMTTPDDTSMATLAEVLDLATSGDAGIVR